MLGYSILIAEDDPIQRMTIRRMLEKEMPFNIIEKSDGSEALDYLKSAEKKPDLALIDLQMPVMDGMKLLKQAKELFPQVPFVILSGSDRVEDIVEAMQLGATDFIPKPAERERLIASVRNALAINDLREEVSRLRRESNAPLNFNDIEEVSPGLKEMIALGRKAATSDIPVLITGESGVGKEVFTQAIHQASNRKNKPLISVNCGALPENLVESTLFGHEKGSFTGAVTKTIGKCREAEGGILFLDEVGELKPDIQVKLLRLLQQGEIEPVGGGKPVKVNLRIVSATNRSLEQLISEGRFREDLFYRLNGLPIHITPLKERKKDIMLLAESLLKKIEKTEQRKDMKFSKEAAEWMKNYSWPGNVREMHHVLSRVVLLSETNIINVEDLSRWVQLRPANNSKNPTGDFIEILDKEGNFKTLEQIEQEAIDIAMVKFDSHIGKVSVALGVGQSTLYKKLKKVPA